MTLAALIYLLHRVCFWFVVWLAVDIALLPLWCALLNSNRRRWPETEQSKP